jgi:hypothetical protein
LLAGCSARSMTRAERTPSCHSGCGIRR